ncbi:RNA-binding protein 42 [Camelus dromedarius]|uniref:RNA-binding protein 42 n=1 Tax=Camelus dromedarius TaxID=9838 RepID=A0A5N4EF71_CAMDR|nr:RNA-binding protein 42 [Camelus dromedarius]
MALPESLSLLLEAVCQAYCAFLNSCREDISLLEWDADDFRSPVGIWQRRGTDILELTFSPFPSLHEANVIPDKCMVKTKGYDFLSFKDPSDSVHTLCEINVKYVGLRPTQLHQHPCKDWNLDIACKKQKEKTLGQR